MLYAKKKIYTSLFIVLVSMFCIYVLGDGSNAQNGTGSRGGWALPSTERVHQSSSMRPNYGDGTFENEQPSANKSSSSIATRKEDKRGGKRFH